MHYTFWHVCTLLLLPPLSNTLGDILGTSPVTSVAKALYKNTTIQYRYRLCNRIVETVVQTKCIQYTLIILSIENIHFHLSKNLLNKFVACTGGVYNICNIIIQKRLLAFGHCLQNWYTSRIEKAREARYIHVCSVRCMHIIYSKTASYTHTF